MIRGKARNTLVMHDAGVYLPHETAVTRKKRSQPRVGCQSLDGNTLSSPLHELDRDTAIASNDPEVLAKDAAAGAEWQEQ